MTAQETTKVLKTLITLKPSELKTTQEMQDFLLEKLIETVVNTCRDDCYVCDVIEVEPIGNGKIGTRGEVDYIIHYKAQVVEPKVGQKLTGNIQKIIGNGIFVVQKPFRCFIAKQFFEEEEWDNLAINEPLTVELQEFRFNKSDIMCIANPLKKESL